MTAGQQAEGSPLWAKAQKVCNGQINTPILLEPDSRWAAVIQKEK